MDWLVYRPGAATAAAAVGIARRLGLDVPGDGPPALERVVCALDGDARAGPLHAVAHTSVQQNRDGDDVYYTTQTVGIDVDGGQLVLDSLGAAVHGNARDDVLAVARAWELEQVLPRLEWVEHPSLPELWRGAVAPRALQDGRVRWRSSVTGTSHALVPQGHATLLVAVASVGRGAPLASNVGRWSSAAEPPPAVGHAWVSQHAAQAVALVARVAQAPVLEWEAHQASPVSLWHVHLQHQAGVAHLQRWQAGRHVVRGVVRGDGAGMAWVIQPLEDEDWCAHLEGVRFDGRWHWSGFTTHPGGVAQLEGLVAP